MLDVRATALVWPLAAYADSVLSAVRVNLAVAPGKSFSHPYSCAAGVVPGGTWPSARRPPQRVSEDVWGVVQMGGGPAALMDVRLAGRVARPEVD